MELQIYRITYSGYTRRNVSFPVSEICIHLPCLFPAIKICVKFKQIIKRIYVENPKRLDQNLVVIGSFQYNSGLTYLTIYRLIPFRFNLVWGKYNIYSANVLLMQIYQFESNVA